MTINTTSNGNLTYSNHGLGVVMIKSQPTITTKKNGDKCWYLNGKLHRTDGPAVEFADDDKEWWLNGKLHRIDGPAFEDSNGYKAWYLNGERHNPNGPAIEYPDNTKYWYLNGEELTEKEFIQQTQKM